MTEEQHKKTTQKDAKKEAKKITVTPEMNAVSKKHTVKELRELLRSMNLRVGGAKNVLILRYLEGLKA